MIASRFRSVGWVGCVAVAALGCYLVSQRVASERASVEALDRRILLTKIEIRKLQTELGTRSRLPVLERWNSDVLALSAPSASQYLHGEVQLASFQAPAAVDSPIRQAAATVDERVDIESPVRTVAMTTPAPVAPVTPAPARPAVEQPMLRHANYVKPAEGSFEAGPRRVSLLDSNVLEDLQKTAQQEKRGAKKTQ